MKQEHAMTPGVLVSDGQAVPSGYVMVLAAELESALDCVTSNEPFYAARELRDIIAKAQPAPAPAERVEQEPVEWQYRTFHGEDTSTPGWDQWERITAAGRYAGETVDMRVREIQDYIDRGYRYELRALYTAPQSSPCIGTELNAEQYTPGDMADQARDAFKAGQASMAGLVEAASKVYAGLNDRIDAAIAERKPSPVFEGIAELHDALAAHRQSSPAPAKCKCSMSIRMLGDGCSVCNPEYLAEMLADQAEDEKEEAIAGLVEALENVLKVSRGSSGRIILDQQDEQDLRDALAAHRQQEG